MKVEINGTTIVIDDELVSTYQIAAGKFNDKVAKFLLETEGYDVENLKADELKSKLQLTMLEEIKQREYLSRPEVREKLIATIRG